MESRPRGFSPRALRQDFTIEALLGEALEGPQDHGGGQLGGIFPIGRLEFPTGQPQPHPQPLREPLGWRTRPPSTGATPRPPRSSSTSAASPDSSWARSMSLKASCSDQAAGNGFTARCLPAIDRERPKPPEDTSTSYQAATDTIARMRELVIRRREDQDANVELLRGVLRRPVIQPDPDARDLLAAASAKFDALADGSDNIHARGFWARAQEQTGTIRRHACLCPDAGGRHTRVLGTCALHPPRGRSGRGRHHLARRPHQVLPPSRPPPKRSPAWPTRPSRSSVKNERRVTKEDGSIAARNVIARMGKGEMRTDAGLREQVLDVLVSHRHLIPTARKGHYMMVVPHD